MRSIAFYCVFLVAACAATPLQALQSQDFPTASSMTPSVSENLLPIDPFVGELVSYFNRFRKPNQTEVAFVEALWTKRRDNIQKFVICPICSASMHEMSAATLTCGHVMHENCFSNIGGERCPTCGDEGPHKFRTRKTVITKALGIFEKVGLIPPMDPREVDVKREMLWNSVDGIHLRQRFIETLRSLHSLMLEIFRFTLDQIRSQRGWSRFSRLFYWNRGGIVRAKAKLKPVMLYQLTALVERIRGGLPESDKYDIPSMPSSHWMSRLQALEYIEALFEIVEQDFETKLTAEYAAAPDPSLFSRWEDRIWWLQVLVRILMNKMVEPTVQSREISSLFNSYVRELPFWTHPESEIVTMEFPFANGIRNHLFGVLDPIFW